MSDDAPTDAPDGARQSAAFGRQVRERADEALGWHSESSAPAPPAAAAAAAEESTSVLRDDVDELLAASPSETGRPQRKRPPGGGPSWRSLHPVELVVLLAVNLVWAFVGPVLWIPLLARTFVTALGRTLHAALTRQGHQSVSSRVRAAASFYSSGFLRPSVREGPTSAQRASLAPLHLLGEAAWATLFWTAGAHFAGLIAVPWRSGLTALQATARDAASGVASLWSGAATRASEGWAQAPEALRAALDQPLLVWVLLALALTVAFVLGVLAGRARR